MREKKEKNHLISVRKKYHLIFFSPSMLKPLEYSCSVYLCKSSISVLQFFTHILLTLIHIHSDTSTSSTFRMKTQRENEKKIMRVES